MLQQTLGQLENSRATNAGCLSSIFVDRHDDVTKRAGPYSRPKITIDKPIVFHILREEIELVRLDFKKLEHDMCVIFNKPNGGRT